MSDAAAGRTMIDMSGDYQPLTRSLWLAVGAVLTNLVSLMTSLSTTAPPSSADITDIAKPERKRSPKRSGHDLIGRGEQPYSRPGKAGMVTRGAI